jgi:hypothetical protein
MDIKKVVRFASTVSALIAFSSLFLLVGQETEPVSSRILKWTETEQVAWLNAYLADGMPPGDALAMLVLNKSSIALPILEKKIEEILGSKSPQELFNNPSADPQRVADLAAAIIAYAGNEQALREESKLIKIDEQRFGSLVDDILFRAFRHSQPFALVYKGFEIGDPAIDKRIIAWIENEFDFERGTKDSGRGAFAKQMWAEAMVDRYSGAPTPSQWARDPVASRLKPEDDASLREQMIRLTSEAVFKRLKR